MIIQTDNKGEFNNIRLLMLVSLLVFCAAKPAWIKWTAQVNESVGLEPPQVFGKWNYGRNNYGRVVYLRVFSSRNRSVSFNLCYVHTYVCRQIEIFALFNSSLMKVSARSCLALHRQTCLPPLPKSLEFIRVKIIGFHCNDIFFSVSTKNF